MQVKNYENMVYHVLIALNENVDVCEFFIIITGI